MITYFYLCSQSFNFHWVRSWTWNFVQSTQNQLQVHHHQPLTSCCLCCDWQAYINFCVLWHIEWLYVELLWCGQLQTWTTWTSLRVVVSSFANWQDWLLSFISIHFRVLLRDYTQNLFAMPLFIQGDHYNVKGCVTGGFKCLPTCCTCMTACA